MKHKIIFFLFKVLGIILCMLFWSASWFWIMMIPYLLLGIGIAVYGSYDIQLNYHIKSINKGKTKGVVLTFDDGPHPENTPKILEILKMYGVKGTFFIIGHKAEKHQSLLKEIKKEGHIIGNHSYSHNNFLPFFRVKKLKKDFEKTAALIEDTIGKKPRFIRPPFGATSPKYFKMMQRVKWDSIGWTIRSYDTVAKNAEQLTANVLKQVIKNESPIVLFHDTQVVTVEALPEILKEFKRKGIEVVSLEESISSKAYE